MSTIAATLDEDTQLSAYRRLRSVRRKNRISELDLFDAFYKAYLSALVATIAIYFGAGVLGNRKLDAHHLAVVTSHGPTIVGLVVALAVAIGLRSGGRGGPMAFERADVRHVLLAPLDKRVSVRGPALRQLRHILFLGLAFGAGIGIVAGRRFPQTIAAWVACDALAGATILILAFGTAMVSGGLRIRRWLADVLGLVCIGWACADAFSNLTTSPFSWIGAIAVWPLKFRPIAFAGIAVALVVAACGAGLVNRISIEAAERRSRLIGQLRFAATLQDVRTVMVLQRQLAQEHLRARPWIRLPKGSRVGFRGKHVAAGVFVRRSLAGMLRWPATRLIRLVILLTIATFAVVGAWGGSSVLIVVAGGATWLGALDLIEGLAQEVDYPDRTGSIPRSTGVIYLRLLIVPFVVMFFLSLIAFAGLYVFAGHRVIVGQLGIVAVSVSACAVAGAALAVTQQPALPSGGMVETPEIASAKFVVRVVLPPAVAIAGFIPLIQAQRAWDKYHTIKHMALATGNTVGFSIAVAFVAFAWVRYRDDIKAFIKSGYAAQNTKPTDAKSKDAKSSDAKTQEPGKKAQRNYKNKNKSKSKGKR